MRLKIAVIGIIFTILSGIVLTEQSKAQETISIDVFYQELSPYGEWTPHPEFGYIWQPYEVGPEWKPYTDGRWEWSNQGWLWISYEPWGWATYHYGRWVFDDYQGWVWIPGTTWAPAWVSWQQSPEYIGWSPLPPDRGFFIEIGFVFNSYNNYYYKPYRHKYYGHKHHHYKKHRKKHKYYHDYYHNPHHYKPPAKHAVFLPHKKFGHHKHAGKAAIPPPHYDVVLRNSRNVTNIKRVNNKVINYGPDKRFIEKRSNRKLVSRNIVNRKNVKIKGNNNVNIVKGDNYNVYRPTIERSNRDPFTTNRNQINNKRLKSNNTNNSPSHKQTQLNKPSAKTDLNSNYKNNGNYKPSVKKGYSKNKEIRGNSEITNRKTNYQNQRKNNNQSRIRTSPQGYDKYSYKNRSSGKSKRLQSGSDMRNYNVRGNNVSINRNKTNNAMSLGRKNTQGSNINAKSGYGQNNERYKKTNQLSNKNYNNKNYSKKNKQSSSKKARVPKSRSYKPNVRTMQTPKNPAFSRR